MMYDELNRLDELSRRKFMQYSAKAFLGLGMASLGQSPLWASRIRPTATANNVIYIYLKGGMSHIDTFDIKPGWKEQGPVEAIASNVTGLKISGYFPNLAKQMDKFAIIRSMSSNQGAHLQGEYFLHTSYEMRGSTQHPGLGAWLGHLSGQTNSTLPGNIRIGGSNNLPGGCGFLETKYDPLHLGNPYGGLPHSLMHQSISPSEFQERLELAKLMDLSFERTYRSKDVKAYTDVYKDASKLMKSEDLAAFDLSEESAKMQAKYGSQKSSFAASCLLARRLVESGVRFVELTSDGWDTHSDNHKDVASLSHQIDQPIAALVEDLDQRGLLDETLIVLATEMGRTPEIDQNLGRNHHPEAFTCLMAGGGILGGQVYGATDKGGHVVTDNLVTIPDFNATIAHALGLPLDKLFYSPDGRPFQVAAKGQAIKALFS